MTKKATTTEPTPVVDDDTEVLTIDFNELTLGDIEDLEEKTGLNMRDLMGKSSKDLPTRALIALVWIAKRHTDPAFTYEDARNVQIGVLGSLDVTDSSADPQ